MGVRGGSGWADRWVRRRGRGQLLWMTMRTLMTRRKIKSARLCCAILMLIWLQPGANQQGEIGEIRDENPPTEWRLNAVPVVCMSVCMHTNCVFCLHVIVPLVLPRPLLSHWIWSCVIQWLCSELFSWCLCCDVGPVTAAGPTGRHTHNLDTLRHAHTYSILIYTGVCRSCQSCTPIGETSANRPRHAHTHMHTYSPGWNHDRAWNPGDLLGPVPANSYSMSKLSQFLCPSAPQILSPCGLLLYDLACS